MIANKVHDTSCTYSNNIIYLGTHNLLKQKLFVADDNERRKKIGNIFFKWTHIFHTTIEWRIANYTTSKTNIKFQKYLTKETPTASYKNIEKSPIQGSNGYKIKNVFLPFTVPSSLPSPLPPPAISSPITPSPPSPPLSL